MYDVATIKVVKQLIDFGENVYLHYSETYNSANSYCERKAREAIKLSLDKSKLWEEKKTEIYDWVCYELFG